MTMKNYSYTEEQIRKSSEDFIKRLENGEFLVETRPNKADVYHGAKEQRDLEAIKNIDRECLYFTSMFRSH